MRPHPRAEGTPTRWAGGATINLAGRVAVVAGGLVLMTLVARLGPQTQGAFALFVAFESALLALFSGFGLVLARAHSRRVAGDAAFEPALHATMLGAAVGLGLLAMPVLLGVSQLTTRAPYAQLWLLALAAPWLLAVPTATAAWMGQGRLVAMNLGLVAAPLLVPALVALWWGLGQLGAAPTLTIAGVLGAWVVGKVLVGAGVLGASWREAGWARPRWALLAPQLGFVATIGLTNVVSLLNYRINLFMVERVQGLGPAGVYSVAVTVAELLWFVSSSITTAVYHRIGNPDPQAAARTALQAMRWSALGVLAGVPLLLGVAWWALPMALGDAYAASWWPLALLMPGTLAYSVASAVSAYFTNHLGKPQLAGRIAALSMGSNLVLSALLVPRFGIAGAATATSLSYSLAIAVGLSMFLRASGLPLRALWARA